MKYFIIHLAIKEQCSTTKKYFLVLQKRNQCF